MQQTVFVLICFLAFAQAGYVVTRLYDREFRNCEKPMPYGIFYETDKCMLTGPNQYTVVKCNSTGIQVSQNCNKGCQQCQVNNNLPINQCLGDFMKYTCEDKLPRLTEDGAVMRVFQTEKCDRDNAGYGQFFEKSFCSPTTAGKSMKIGLTDPKTFKQQEYGQLECKGNVIKEFAVKLDVCTRIPSPFQKMLTMKQPGQFMMISRK